MKKAKVAGYVLQLSFFVFHLKIHKFNEFFYVIELISLSLFLQIDF